ncbi:histone H3.v1-like [Penaeus indicus]|uniref:histone H3.v1-like n=1 Tax=Penaeus indicus TaxID=29960 RepID=UPI00300CEF19
MGHGVRGQKVWIMGKRSRHYELLWIIWSVGMRPWVIGQGYWSWISCYGSWVMVQGSEVLGHGSWLDYEEQPQSTKNTENLKNTNNNLRNTQNNPKNTGNNLKNTNNKKINPRDTKNKKINPRITKNPKNTKNNPKNTNDNPMNTKKFLKNTKNPKNTKNNLKNMKNNLKEHREEQPLEDEEQPPEHLDRPEEREEQPQEREEQPPEHLYRPEERAARSAAGEPRRGPAAGAPPFRRTNSSPGTMAKLHRGHYISPHPAPPPQRVAMATANQGPAVAQRYQRRAADSSPFHRRSLRFRRRGEPRRCQASEEEVQIEYIHPEHRLASPGCLPKARPGAGEGAALRGARQPMGARRRPPGSAAAAAAVARAPSAASAEFSPRPLPSFSTILITTRGNLKIALKTREEKVAGNTPPPPDPKTAPMTPARKTQNPSRGRSLPRAPFVTEYRPRHSKMGSVSSAIGIFKKEINLPSSSKSSRISDMTSCPLGVLSRDPDVQRNGWK